MATPQPAKQVPQHIAALSASLGGFIAGTMLGWTNPAQKEVMDGNMGASVSEDQFSWVGASMTLGAAVTCVPIGFVVDRIGRRITMLLLPLPIIAGWLMLMYGGNVWLMYIGRFLQGMGAGAFCVASPLYTGEIAQKEIRGTLGAYFQLNITFGILAVYLLGWALKVRWMSWVCMGVAIVFFWVFIFMPESPAFLMKVDKEAQANRAMAWLRGPAYDASVELKEIRDTEMRIKEQKVAIGPALRRRASLKALGIGLGLMFFQQMCGINAVIFYSTDIFALSRGGLSPKLSTVVIGCVQVVATFVATLLVDRTGRRLLLLISGSVMALSTTALGVYFFLQDRKYSGIGALAWLPVTSLCFFIIVFSIGYGPVPWLMMGELFASDVKGVAASIAATLNWTLAFLVSKTYVNLKELLGAGATFWIYSVMSVVGVLFVLFFVLETKGKSLNEIQQELGAGSKAAD